MFGSKKLPEIGDALGKGIRAFKKASEKAFEEDESGDAAKTQDQQGQFPQGSAAAKESPSSVEKKV
jgi:TatA/E family protein of Tat protein translocase